jgi:predicted transcriptional regulator
MEAMDNEFRKRKESPQPAENQPREKRSTMSPEAEKMDKDWGALGAVMGVDPREAQRLSDMMKGETNEAEFEKEMEEGNAFTDKLRHTPKGGKFKLGNKEYTDNSSLEEEVLYKLQSGKDSELFTESEIVDMIEQIIMEEKDNIKKGKTPAGLEAYEKAHKGSGKENDDYMKEFTKKITEYTKDGSKEKFTTDAKHFPKGNGELEKMSKKAYVMSDNGKEFLEDYMSPGMEDLVPEEIEYDEDWVKDNIKGSSRTGNNPEWANAVETDLGEKLVKKQKAKKFHKAKETAYRKSKQPVTDGTGENSGSGVNIKLESVDKKTEKLNEEFNRMKSLIGYSQRTQ